MQKAAEKHDSWERCGRWWGSPQLRQCQLRWPQGGKGSQSGQWVFRWPREDIGLDFKILSLSKGHETMCISVTFWGRDAGLGWAHPVTSEVGFPQKINGEYLLSFSLPSKSYSKSASLQSKMYSADQFSFLSGITEGRLLFNAGTLRTALCCE